MWWLGLSAKRTTLSSMLGQYRGPVEAIWPEYIGARCRLARMMSWIAGLVAPIQQFTCGRGGDQRRACIKPRMASAVKAGGPPMASAAIYGRYSFKYENG